MFVGKDSNGINLVGSLFGDVKIMHIYLICNFYALIQAAKPPNLGSLKVVGQSISCIEIPGNTWINLLY